MYSPTRLYKRYFSTPELRDQNFETYKHYFNSKHWPIQYRLARSIFSSVKSNDSDACHTFTKQQHFVTWRYLEVVVLLSSVHRVLLMELTMTNQAYV